MLRRSSNLWRIGSSSFRQRSLSATTSAGSSVSRSVAAHGFHSSSSSSSDRPASFRKGHASDSSDNRLIVVGSGVAGSAAALIAAETYGASVVLLCAGSAPTDCNSYWAQGGIIYRNRNPASNDSAASLAADIHRAGAGLCRDDAVQKVAHEGPQRVDELLLSRQQHAFGSVPFDKNPKGDPYNNDYSLCLEASHAAQRILHRADSTGAAITEELTQAVLRHPNIRVVTDTLVTDLIVQDDDSGSGDYRHINNNDDGNGSHKMDEDRICVGVETLQADGTRSQLRAPHGVVLASGGLAGIYQHSTNPSGFNAMGSSVAIAARAGVATRDLEYVQFHPTVLYSGVDQPRFLLTEALRGEGAKLRNEEGNTFCENYHPDAELAPRDVVSRAVFLEAQQTENWVYLDITHRDADFVRSRFPTIQAHLQRQDLDLATNQLHITPAAHYTCGGITTDLSGRTSLRGLYAAGEAACTGLHGGNRLASTSLLEGLVFGASVADHILDTEAGKQTVSRARDAIRRSSQTVDSQVTAGEAQPKAQHLLDELKKTMWDEVGVVRTPARLQRAVDTLQDFQDRAAQLPLTWETVAVKDATTAGLQVAQAAAQNNVSAGAHFVAPDDESDDDEEVWQQAGAQ